MMNNNLIINEPIKFLATILVIDDLPENVTILADLLTLRNYDVRIARNGQLALTSLEYFTPDLILLDIKMPNLDGYQVCERLKANPKTAEIPVIFLSALDSAFDKVKAFEVGGVDYITKPFQELEVVTRISHHLNLVRQKQYLEREIKERKKAEEIGKEALQIKSRFLANMSHEIRTPLNAILGIAELLSFTELNLQQKDFINILQSSSNHLLLLINDILDYSKLESQEVKLENQAFNLTQLIEEILDLFSVQANLKGIELYYCKSPDVPTQLTGDAFRLRQILTNLVSNALKFTHQGHIIIRLSLHSSQPLTVCFAVEDTGIGIKKEATKSIFKAFSQAENSTTRLYGGTGLGLSICQQLVKLMGGKIEVKSEIDQGSTFWFTVPFSNYSFPKLIEQCLLEDQWVLILDKNVIRRQIITQYLTEWKINYLPIFPELFEKQLSLITQKFSLVILDQKIINNRKLIITLQEKIPNSKLIILSKSPDYKIPDYLSLAKIFADLKYPFKPSILNQCLLEFFSGYSSFIRESLEDSYHKNTTNAKLLLVEDTEVNQKVIVNLLNLLDYQVDWVNNGEEALNKLENNHYDLVFMDCQMPVLNGYDATKKIRKKERNKSHTIIIGLTAYSLKGDKEKCLEAGMDDYLSKPVNLQQLSQMINKWLKNQILDQENPFLEAQLLIPIQSNNEQNYFKCSSPIDFERLEDFTGGNNDFAKEIIGFFITDMFTYLTELEEAIENKQIEEVKYLAHKIKGTSANIGVKYMPEISSRIELLATTNLTASQELTLELKQIFNQVKTYLPQNC